MFILFLNAQARCKDNQLVGSPQFFFFCTSYQWKCSSISFGSAAKQAASRYYSSCKRCFVVFLLPAFPYRCWSEILRHSPSNSGRLISTTYSLVLYVVFFHLFRRIGFNGTFYFQDYFNVEVFTSSIIHVIERSWDRNGSQCAFSSSRGSEASIYFFSSLHR